MIGSVLPSVRQEVDLDVGVPGSAVVSDRKFFGSKNRDDQLMTHFVVPQLHLFKIRTLEPYRAVEEPLENISRTPQNTETT